MFISVVGLLIVALFIQLIYLCFVKSFLATLFHVILCDFSIFHVFSGFFILIHH